MPSNSFGKIFRITTWGESHGKAIGVVIDGCPAGLEVSEKEIQAALDLRAPGKNRYTSPRTEEDKAEIFSGLVEGRTTGAPIAIVIGNKDADSTPYESIKDILRPGHANYTYLEKYGLFDHRGGGRASARETACRVAAGAVAKKLLSTIDLQVAAYIKQIGPREASVPDPLSFSRAACENPLFCPDEKAAIEMMALLDEAKASGDSLGAIVEFIAAPVPTGLGDPVYEKMEANLASAMMSIPAAKGFEIGSGFRSALMRGSEHNDRFIKKEGKVQTETNHAGGVLGGISNGMPIIGRVAFKPTSSIRIPQESLSLSGEQVSLDLPAGSRHDPCVAIRAVPVVEAMAALVLADALLIHRSARC